MSCNYIRMDYQRALKCVTQFTSLIHIVYTMCLSYNYNIRNNDAGPGTHYSRMHYNLSNNFAVFLRRISLNSPFSLHTSRQHPVLFNQMSEIMICSTIRVTKVYCYNCANVILLQPNETVLYIVVTNELVYSRLLAVSQRIHWQLMKLLL